jgi:hypothetical protein
MVDVAEIPLRWDIEASVLLPDAITSAHLVV